MPVRTPSTPPQFVTSSEQTVYDKLVAQLPDDCYVIPNLRISDTTKDHEADLVVLMPGSGVVIVEVKGSHVWHDGEDWWIRRENADQRIDPVGQARDAQYALRAYVERDPRWGGRTRVRWGHHVVLARTPLDDGFATPDCPRHLVSGENDLTDLAGRVWDTTARHKNDARFPDQGDVDAIVEILAGRHLPARDVAHLAQDREEQAQRLTLEQATLLKVTRLINRVEVRGGAGSGKTVMAIQQAKDLASGRLRDDRQRQRVAVVCYSNGLASHLRRELLVGSHSKRPAFVGTFENLGNLWGAQSGSRDDSAYWEEEFPRRLADLARALPDGKKFDAIIVDEAQDFADSWWTPLVASLRDEENGGLFVYSDERQRVFPRFGRPPIALVPLVLDHNLRNTRQIASAFAPLAPRMEPRGADGVHVTFIPTTVDDALGAADDAVEQLFAEGWHAGDIALITMGRRHPVQVERQEAGQDAYWADFWTGEDIFYGHVLGLKGLERRAVVLCVNIAAEAERAAEKLYVGLSRATDRLIVVGDPAEVRAIGGPAVAARLGIGPNAEVLQRLRHKDRTGAPINRDILTAVHEGRER